MSFEAVPCMFKGRAEDGNEASLFGLLIRPSSSTLAGGATSCASAGSGCANLPPCQTQKMSLLAAPNTRKRGRRKKEQQPDSGEGGMQLISAGSILVDPAALIGAMGAAVNGTTASSSTAYTAQTAATTSTLAQLQQSNNVGGTICSSGSCNAPGMESLAAVGTAEASPVTWTDLPHNLPYSTPRSLYHHMENSAQPSFSGPSHSAAHVCEDNGHMPPMNEVACVEARSKSKKGSANRKGMHHLQPQFNTEELQQHQQSAHEWTVSPEDNMAAGQHTSADIGGMLNNVLPPADSLLMPSSSSCHQYARLDGVNHRQPGASGQQQAVNGMHHQWAGEKANFQVHATSHMDSRGVHQGFLSHQAPSCTMANSSYASSSMGQNSIGTAQPGVYDQHQEWSHYQQHMAPTNPQPYMPSAASQHPHNLMIAAPPIMGAYSTTPDSGVQSIDGSPPSISSFTPPMVSPYTTQVTSVYDSSLQYLNSIPQMSVASTSSSATTNPKGDECPTALEEGEQSGSPDLSDMPVLVPITAANEEVCARGVVTRSHRRATDSPEYSEPPILRDTPTPKAETSQSTTEVGEKQLLFAVTSTMDLSELAERLYSNIDADQLKRLTLLIQSKTSTQEPSEASTNAECITAFLQPEAPSTPTETTQHRRATPQNGCGAIGNTGSDEEEKEAEEGEDAQRQRLATFRCKVKARMDQKVEEMLRRKVIKRLASLHLNRASAMGAAKTAAEQQPMPFAWLTRIDWKEAAKRARNHPLSRSIRRRVGGSGCDSKRKRKSESGQAVVSQLMVTKQQKKQPPPLLSAHYDTIKANVLLETPPPKAKPNSLPYQEGPCQCSLQAPCSTLARCANREARVECTGDRCELSPSHCQNRRLANNETLVCSSENSWLEVFSTSQCGHGLRTLHPLEEGTLVGEYVGEVMKRSTYLRRYSSAVGEQTHRYGLELVAGFVVDAAKKGNLTRFANHSCEANCEIQRWEVNGQSRLAIITLRAIKTGEELTYHYGKAGHVSLNPPQQCFCGNHPSSHPIPLPTAADRRKRKATSPVNEHRPSKAAKGVEGEEEKLIPKGSYLNGLKTNRKHSKMNRILRLEGVELQYPEIAHLLIKLFHDFYVFCRDEKKVPERHLKLMRKNVRKVFLLHSRPSPADCAGSLLRSFDEAVKHSLEAFRASLGLRRSRALVEKYGKLKISIAEFANELQNIPLAALEERDECETTMSALAVPKEAWLTFTGSSCSTTCNPTTVPMKREHSSGRKSAPREDKLPTTEVVATPTRTLNVEADLSYLESDHPVGSYDPDEWAMEAFSATVNATSEERSSVDFVRCICGIMEDEGVMCQCEQCLFWVHAACLDFDIETKEAGEFACDFCTRQLQVTPRVDVALRPQPSMQLRGCTYYRALVNSKGVQVRVNEALYVTKLDSYEHKAMLRDLHDGSPAPSQLHLLAPSPKKKRITTTTAEAKSTTAEEEELHQEMPIPNEYHERSEVSNANNEKRLFHRGDLRIFRVERLLKGPSGERFVFGCYYARPHETFCDSSRLFHRNELFWTPFYDTLPLDSVVGRCLVVEPQVWRLGRPKSPRYREEDVYMCEYQIGKNQRSFEKILPKNHYHISTEPYVFDRFEVEAQLIRDFTPFVISSPKQRSSLSPQKACGKAAGMKRPREQSTTPISEEKQEAVEPSPTTSAPTDPPIGRRETFFTASSAIKGAIAPDEVMTDETEDPNSALLVT